MFLLREPHDAECIQRLKSRYPHMDPTGLRTIMCLMRTAHEVTAGFECFLSHHRLSHGRFAILMYLNRDPEKAVNQTQLADAYGVTKATITGLIDGLEADFMVERLSDPDDRRASLVRLAQAGRDFLAGFVPQHFSCLAELMSALSTAEHAQLVDLLERIRSRMDQLIASHDPDPSCSHGHAAHANDPAQPPPSSTESFRSS
jgi:DNA-binding MarR family transcriptional regulator